MYRRHLGQTDDLSLGPMPARGGAAAPAYLSQLTVTKPPLVNLQSSGLPMAVPKCLSALDLMWIARCITNPSNAGCKYAYAKNPGLWQGLLDAHACSGAVKQVNVEDQRGTFPLTGASSCVSPELLAYQGVYNEGFGRETLAYNAKVTAGPNPRLNAASWLLGRDPSFKKSYLARPACRAPVLLTPTPAAKPPHPEHPATITLSKAVTRSADHSTPAGGKKTTSGGAAAPAPSPTTAGMSDTTKYALIGGGVLAAGLVAFLLVGSKKKPAVAKPNKWTGDR